MFVSDVFISNARNTVGNLLRVREGEGRKLLMFWIPFFLTLCGNFLAWSVLQSSFIANFGAEATPYLFLASSVAILFGSLLDAKLVARYRKTVVARLFIGTSVLLLLAGWYLYDHAIFGQASAGIAVALTLLGNSTFLSFISTLLWTTANDVFNSAQAKRLFPLLNIAGTVSGVASGAALQWLTPMIGPVNMLIPAAICTGLSLPFFLRIQQVFDRELDWDLQFAPQQTKQGSVRRMFTEAFKSRYILALAAVVFISWLLNRIFGFVFVAAVDQAYPTEAAFMQFSGLYLMVYSVGSIAFDALFLNRILDKIGLTRGLFLTSNVVTFFVLGMLAFPIFPVILAVNYVRDVILSIQSNSLQVMFGALPNEDRSRISAFIDGMVVTAGGVGGSLLVILVQKLLPAQSGFALMVQVFSGIVIALLAIRFAVNFSLRREFFRELESQLATGDIRTKLRAIETLVEHKYLKRSGVSLLIDVLQNEAEPLPAKEQALIVLGHITDPTTMRTLIKELRSEVPALRLAAARALGEFHLTSEQFYQVAFSRYHAVAELRALFERDADPEMRAVALDALIHLEDADAVAFLLKLLRRADAETRSACLHSLRLFHDPSIIDPVRPLLTHADPVLRNHAIVALWQFTWEQVKLRPVIQAMLPVARESAYLKLSSDMREAMRVGVKTIGDVGAQDYVAFLQQGLKWRKAPVIRFECALSLFKLGLEDGQRVIREVLESTDQAAITRIITIARTRVLQPEAAATLQENIDQALLQYPRSTPSIEKLNRPLSLIPKPCLEQLAKLYSQAGEGGEAKKIHAALGRKGLSVKTLGQVTLIEPDAILRQMYEVVLLAQGYEVTIATQLPKKAKLSGVYVVDIEEADTFDVSNHGKARSRMIAIVGRGYIAGSKTSNTSCGGVVYRHHYSPDELTRAIELCLAKH